MPSSLFSNVPKIADIFLKRAGVCKTDLVCQVIYLFLKVFWLNYNYAKFCYCGIYKADLNWKETGFWNSCIPWVPSKGPALIVLTEPQLLGYSDYESQFVL